MNCVYFLFIFYFYLFFKFYEIFFENHILYEKVISIKIIVIYLFVFDATNTPIPGKSGKLHGSEA